MMGLEVVAGIASTRAKISGAMTGSDAMAQLIHYN